MFLYGKEYIVLDFWVDPWPFKPMRRVRFPYTIPSFVKVSARESHAGQHSSKVLVSKRQTGSTPGGSEDPRRLVATLDYYPK